MRATVSIHEPNIARDATLGDLFVSHKSGLQDCVLAMTDAPTCQTLSNIEPSYRVVVIACRIGPNEVGYLKTGSIVLLRPDAPITFVESVDSIAFRERKPRSNG